jgi:hypothetical protein
MSGIFIVLDCYNPFELFKRKELAHDGGLYLRWLIERQSILPNQWTHGYCCRKTKKEIPTQKEVRKKFLETSMSILKRDMEEAKRHFGKIVIVGLGKLSCECLLDRIDLSDRAGTYWTGVRPMWYDVIDEGDKVWIANSPDAALFDHVLIVEITRVLKQAARQANIRTLWRPNDDLPMPDLSGYL